ncbi:MAG: hypothetical protein AAB427_03605, partial [Chloroflexota bacterium]
MIPRPYFALVLLAASALACDFLTGQASPLADTPAPITRPNITPTVGQGELFFVPSASPTASGPEPSAGGIKSELYFGVGGGGDGALCPAWLSPDTPLPFVGFYPGHIDSDTIIVCAVGFSPEESLTIELYETSRELIASGNFFVDGSDLIQLLASGGHKDAGSAVSPEVTGTSAWELDISVRWPADFPDDGLVAVSSGSAQSESVFTVGQRVTAYPSSGISGDDLFGSRSCPVFSASDTVNIAGGGFSPGSA